MPCTSIPAWVVRERYAPLFLQANNTVDTCAQIPESFSSITSGFLYSGRLETALYSVDDAGYVSGSVALIGFTYNLASSP